MNDRQDPGFDEITVVGYRPTRQPAVPSPQPALQPPLSTARPGPANDPRRQRFSALGLGAGLAPKADVPADRLQKSEPGAERITPRLPGDRKETRLDGGSLSEIASGPDDALVGAAIHLLVIVAQIRDDVAVTDMPAFQREVADHIRKFDDQAIKLGAKASDISAARYVLCSLIDETVMTTSWGEASDWSSNSLLNQFHGETWGGEKVFEILDQAKREPASRLGLLRLIDHVLLLGFEGVFRVRENGKEQLESLREEIGTIIAGLTRAPDSELSGYWRGIEAARRRLRQYVPVWVVMAITGALLFSFYGVQQFRLYNSLDSITRQLERVGSGK
ncbi:COG3455 Type VI protein secretion system component VasF [Rhabdaerophilaceae bacterium]